MDVAAFAQRFGGGGHARAAGVKAQSPAAAAKVVEAIAAALRAGH